ncbi:hypothetical protein BKP35_04835 [Anaerobacillus arseniciselenatis]|uniref:DUF3887 domain-containing protein n=1 Tax=Anaerobacillus arseniciselenatis TaxID=85682 RepID=A0A1S2LRM9_9BACI|nr:DUF3887 domain-containing protein [Anaerobacillus arseniciselenatis]OIJ15179.1 hypothetical protein BKP35_04835 [Anaerobacillus arseniciselenatis]
MKNVLLIGFVSALLILTGCNDGEEQEIVDKDGTQENAIGETDGETEEIDMDEAISIAESFIEHLSQGEFEEAAEFFNETMAAEIGAKELGEIWVTLESQIGTSVDQDFNSTQEVEEYLVVLINGLFEGADVLFTVTISSNYQIAGFFVQ